MVSDNERLKMKKDQWTDRGTVVFLNLSAASQVVEATYWASVHRRLGDFRASVLHNYMIRLIALCSTASKEPICTINVYGTKKGKEAVSKSVMSSAYIAELMRENSDVIISITPTNRSWSLSVEWKSAYPDTITIDLRPLNDAAQGICQVVQTLSDQLFVEPNMFKRLWRFLNYKISQSAYLPPEKD